jgi:hypothetical protein
MKSRPNPRRAVAVSGSLINAYVEAPANGDVLFRVLLPQEGTLLNLYIYVEEMKKGADSKLLFSVENTGAVFPTYTATLRRGLIHFDLGVVVEAGTRLSGRFFIEGEAEVRGIWIGCLYAPSPSPDNVVLIDTAKDNAIETLTSLRTQG